MVEEFAGLVAQLGGKSRLGGVMQQFGSVHDMGMT